MVVFVQDLEVKADFLAWWKTTLSIAHDGLERGRLTAFSFAKSRVEGCCIGRQILGAKGLLETEEEVVDDLMAETGGPARR